MERPATAPTLRIEIPGRPVLQLTDLLLDYNGTLACDGILIDGVAERLSALASRLTVHVLTADTFGDVARQVSGLPVTLAIVQSGGDKLRYVRGLGPAHAVAVGNGSIDVDMLSVAALGIGVIGPEGACGGVVRAADLVVGDIRVALDLLLKPKRLIATLRP